ncbi:MAG: hypothetical protein ACR2M9_04840 [Cyanophyceae cyanobacterium]
MGFSVGDIFGKNFLSADTIIRGRTTKKVFNATMTNLSVDGTPVPNTGFKQIITGEVVNGKSAGPNGWAFKSIKSVHNKKSKTGKLNVSEAAEFFKSYGGENTGDDRMILYGDDAFNFHPATGTTAKFKFRYVTNKTSSSSKKSSPYDYVVNIKRGGTSLPTAAQSSSYPTITGYAKQDATSSGSGYAGFTMEFDGDQSNDYWSIDMSSRSGGIGQSNFETGGKRFLRSGSKSPESQDIDRVEITLLSIVKNPVKGCNDSQATNYNPKADENDGSCVFKTSTINSFSIDKSVIKVGEPVKIAWTLNSAKFSEIQVLRNGSVITTSTIQNSDFEDTPPQGDYLYELNVIWNKGTAQPVKSSTKSLNVQAPQSYIQCTDPNREQDENGECASCKTNYYLDSTSGLCSQCTDPNREKLSDGKCGDCNSGFSLKDGTCQKAGCTTEGNYNYDETAVVHDESMCYEDNNTGDTGEPTPEPVNCELSEWSEWSEWSDWSDTETSSGTRTRTRNRTIVTEPANDGVACESTEETETETKDPETGDVVKTTTAADPVRARVTPTESSFPIIPVVGGVLLLGVLLLRR